MFGFDKLLGKKHKDDIQSDKTDLFDKDLDNSDSGIKDSENTDSDKIVFQHVEPKDIERRSMEIIQEELDRRGVQLPEVEASVIKRCIHTSADFDYYENLAFTHKAVEWIMGALVTGAAIVTDTEMAKAGISKVDAERFCCEVFCFMSDPKVAREAKDRGVTRATVSMEHAAKLAKKYHNMVFVIGNAPTALIELERLIREEGLRPAGIIAVPVGFVNVVEAKELIWELCNSEKFSDIPLIVAKGRKGGSNIAAAIVNALFYGVAV